MIQAAIDIGTNTVLLLIAEVKEGEFRVLHEEQRTPRLGKGVDASKNLHPDSVKRVIEILKEYRELLEKHDTEISKTVVTATSAVRDAGNRAEFMQMVKKETGFEIVLLSGLQEAEYTYKGALGVLPDIEQSTVIDIGGGSTEVCIGKKQELLDSHSFDVGSVRFSERYLKHNPPLKTEVKACKEAIEETFIGRPLELNSSSSTISGSFLVGVAGTVTSLAFMELQLESYKPEAINGYIITDRMLSDWIQKLSPMTAQDIELEFPEVMRGRADVILGGLLILEGFMKYYSFTKLTVSTGGIRHGAILNN